MLDKMLSATFEQQTPKFNSIYRVFVFKELLFKKKKNAKYAYIEY